MDNQMVFQSSIQYLQPHSQDRDFCITPTNTLLLLCILSSHQPHPSAANLFIFVPVDFFFFFFRTSQKLRHAAYGIYVSSLSLSMMTLRFRHAPCVRTSSVLTGSSIHCMNVPHTVCFSSHQLIEFGLVFTFGHTGIKLLINICYRSL